MPKDTVRKHLGRHVDPDEEAKPAPSLLGYRRNEFTKEQKLFACPHKGSTPGISHIRGLKGGDTIFDFTNTGFQNVMRWDFMNMDNEMMAEASALHRNATVEMLAAFEELRNTSSLLRREVGSAIKDVRSTRMSFTSEMSKMTSAVAAFEKTFPPKARKAQIEEMRELLALCETLGELEKNGTLGRLAAILGKATP